MTVHTDDLYFSSLCTAIVVLGVRGGPNSQGGAIKEFYGRQKLGPSNLGVRGIKGSWAESNSRCILAAFSQQLAEHCPHRHSEQSLDFGMMFLYMYNTCVLKIVWSCCLTNLLVYVMLAVVDVDVVLLFDAGRTLSVRKTPGRDAWREEGVHGGNAARARPEARKTVTWHAQHAYFLFFASPPPLQSRYGRRRSVRLFIRDSNHHSRLSKTGGISAL